MLPGAHHRSERPVDATLEGEHKHRNDRDRNRHRVLDRIGLNEGKPHRQRQRQQQIRRSVEHDEAEPAADANEEDEFPHAVADLIRTRGFDRLLELGQQQQDELPEISPAAVWVVLMEGLRMTVAASLPFGGRARSGF